MIFRLRIHSVRKREAATCQGTAETLDRARTWMVRGRSFHESKEPARRAAVFESGGITIVVSMVNTLQYATHTLTVRSSTVR